jgi:thiamine biosynthesis lipoprotein ApbE
MTTHTLNQLETYTRSMSSSFLTLWSTDAQTKLSLTTELAKDLVAASKGNFQNDIEGKKCITIYNKAAKLPVPEFTENMTTEELHDWSLKTQEKTDAVLTSIKPLVDLWRFTFSNEDSAQSLVERLNTLTS